jgi:hypothetical protein
MRFTDKDKLLHVEFQRGFPLVNLCYIGNELRIMRERSVCEIHLLQKLSACAHDDRGTVHEY